MISSYTLIQYIVYMHGWIMTSPDKTSTKTLPFFSSRNPFKSAVITLLDATGLSRFHRFNGFRPPVPMDPLQSKGGYEEKKVWMWVSQDPALRHLGGQSHHEPHSSMNKQVSNTNDRHWSTRFSIIAIDLFSFIVIDLCSTRFSISGRIRTHPCEPMFVQRFLGLKLSGLTQSTASNATFLHTYTREHPTLE